LLSLDDPESDICKTAKKKAADAFDRIAFDEQSLSPARYMTAGFYGIYQLATENDPEKALDQFRLREQYSQVTGTRFAFLDHLFSCCHAVAADRLDAKEGNARYLKPEVDYYLEETKKAAGSMGHPFYIGLYEAALAEVSKHRKQAEKARRHKINSQLMVGIGIPRQRILQIFQSQS
jgi:hypothetical protein